jgi:formylglycine-generating enzyme
MRFADGTSFAIDATEVTVTSYGKFLATGSTPETGPVAHPDVCTWNTQFAPKADAQDLDPNCATYFDFDKLLEDESSLPVVCVDWCDASAYCAWAGGHLCGLQGGAPMMRDDFGETDEWYSACSSAGTRTYSYGTEFDAKACNTLASGNGSIAITVATLPTCEGPSPGLFDMNGNADEWVAACDSFDTEGASFVSCYRVGGAFFQGGAAQSRCSSAYPGYRGLHGNDTGFRCCYDR